MKQKKVWKKAITIFTCLAVVASTIFGFVYFDFDRQIHNPKTWESYTSENNRFNIQFPKDPEEGSKEMNIANTKIEYNELKTEVESTSYAVSYLDFPGKWKLLGVNKLLGKTFEMLMKEEKGLEKIQEKKLTSHNGHPAFAYKYIAEGNEVQGRLIIVGNTLYRLTVKYPQAMAEKIQPQAFLESFSIKN